MDAREIANRLTDLGIPEGCPVCGAEEMRIIPSPYMLMRDTNPVMGTTVAGLICEQCGYLRLHAAKALSGEIPELLEEKE